MVRVTYLAPGESPHAEGRVVLVRPRGPAEDGCRLRGNNLAGCRQVEFLAPSPAALDDAIARASHYADGCRIGEIFVRTTRE